MKSSYSCLQKTPQSPFRFLPHAVILCQIYCTASPIFLPRGTARSKQPGRMECWPTWSDRELLFQKTRNPKILSKTFKNKWNSRKPPHDLTLHQTNSASLAFQLPHGPVGTTSGAHDEKIDVMKSGNTVQNKNRNFGIFRHHFLSSWNMIALPKVLSLWFIHSLFNSLCHWRAAELSIFRLENTTWKWTAWELVEDSFAYLHNISISIPAKQFYRQPFKGAAGSDVWMISDLTHLLSQLMHPHKLGSLANSEGTQSACQSTPTATSCFISNFSVRQQWQSWKFEQLNFPLGYPGIHNENALYV